MSATLKNRAFLEELLKTPSPTGFEIPGQKVWINHMHTFADSVLTDAYGSAAAHIIVEGATKTVMIEAHADEIGMVVQYIDESGFVYISRIGGSDPSIARARRIHIHNKKGIVEGVIGNTAIHLQAKDNSNKTPHWRDLFVDIGVSSREEALTLIQIGDPITYVDQIEWLNDEIITARALDNRIGGFIIANVLENLCKKRKKLKVNVVALNAVQEEIGGFGARMMTHRLRPDIAIVTDVTHATDTPGINQKEHGAVKMGAGPSLTRGAGSHPSLSYYISDIAEAAKIEIQYEAAGIRTGTDTDSIYHIRDGVPSVLISLPLRYMHSPVEMAHVRDIDDAISLITEAILKMDGTRSFYAMEEF
jgi:putative aminopeptidase FrvX